MQFENVKTLVITIFDSQAITSIESHNVIKSANSAVRPLLTLLLSLILSLYFLCIRNIKTYNKDIEKSFNIEGELKAGIYYLGGIWLISVLRQIAYTSQIGY